MDGDIVVKMLEYLIDKILATSKEASRQLYLSDLQSLRETAGRLTNEAKFWKERCERVEGKLAELAPHVESPTP